MSGYNLGLAHNEWSTSLGIRQEFLTYGQGLGNDSGLAASANYFSLGQLDERADSGALLGSSNASVLAGNLGYGFSMLRGHALKLGVAAEYGMQDLYGSSQSELDGSLGMLYDFSGRFSMGISANHLGGGVGGFSLPESASAGFQSPPL